MMTKSIIYNVKAADMISGAVLAAESGKDQRFYQSIEKEIISIKRINWPEAKRRFFQTKNLPEPTQAPIQNKL